MANAQKRGFRFPWGGDERHDDATEGGGADLGSGPFDLESGRSAADDAAASARPAAKAASSTAEVGSGVAGQTNQRAEAAMQADEAVMSEAATEGATTSWPEVDRRGPARPLMQPDAQAAATTPSASTTPERRSNPLVAGLVKAMREAARAAREEAVTSLRAEAVAHGEAIRAASTVTTAELRKTADADMAGIREWSKAELARIREETEQRLADRRAQLVQDTEAEALASENRLGQLEQAIRAFEAETEAFFDTLLAEEDPARLAGLAERMPAPPALGDFATAPVDLSALTAAAGRASTHDADATAQAGVEDEATTRADEATETSDANEAGHDVAPDAEQLAPEPGPDAAEAAEAEAARAEAAQAADGNESRPEPGSASESTPDADHLDAAAAAEAEAAASAGLDRRTIVRASGLTGVAGIARFKGELMRIPGVSAVSVTAGAAGEFQFAITHDAQADLRSGLGSMSAFETRVIADDGATVSVVTHEAAA